MCWASSAGWASTVLRPPKANHSSKAQSAHHFISVWGHVVCHKHHMCGAHAIMNKVLVTGGAGFLGSHLCDRLVRDGHDVLCVDNYYTGNKDNIASLFHHSRFEALRHDVTFPSMWKPTTFTILPALHHPRIISMTPSKRPRPVCTAPSTCWVLPTA